MTSDLYNVTVKKIKNTNKFRQPAIRFEKNGYYCPARMGSSDYIEYWEKEMDYCINGFTSEDGDYITGYNYFYLNYCPIIKVVNDKVTGNSRKEVGSPRYWDYDREFFLAVEEAEKLGKHLVVLKARRKGYSYKVASMLCRNFYLIPESKNYAFAGEMEFLTKDGILSKAWDMFDFIDEFTAWYKKRQKTDTKIHKRASYIFDKEGVKIEAGYKSEIMGVSLKNDANKIRGKAGRLMIYEEAGKFPNLKEAWMVAKHSVEQGDDVFGLMIAFGTGGTADGDYEGLRDLFYEPQAYGCLECENIWDDGASKSCGFFVPVYQNFSEKFMDAEGNSDVKGAVRYSLEERENIIKSATDRNTIDRHVAELPFTPQEATLQISSNIFPKAELSKQLAFVRTNKNIQEQKQVGELVFNTDGILEWKQSKYPNDITKYRMDSKKDDPSGSIVIWEHPVDNPSYGLYIAGCLLPGEKVVTNEGLVNVEDVTPKHKLINKEGEAVDIKVFQRRQKENHDVYKFKMSNTYRTTEFTRGHPLWISKTGYNSNKTINEDRFNFNFTKANEVSVGDWTQWPNVYKKKNDFDIASLWDNYKVKKGKYIDNPLKKEDFWWLVGLWLGDGCCYNNKVSLSFNSREIYYINKATNIISEIINRSPQLIQKSENCVEIVFNSKQLCNFLIDTFGKHAHGKYLSEWVKKLEPCYKSQLVWGYLASDGSVTKHTKGYYQIEFVSVSLRLLEDVQDILFSLNTVSGLSKLRDAKKSIIQRRTVSQKDTYHLRLSHHSVFDLIHEISISSKNEQYYFHSVYDDPKINRIDWGNLPRLRKRPKDGCFISKDGDYIYFQIKKIDHRLYTGTVYNFECDTHNYISHHISQKNCDPYDHDKSGTNSLGSTFIYKRFQGFESYYDVVVAEYTGRPDRAEDYYENVRKLLMYYNAKLLYENERKGLYVYFEHKHQLSLLADQPDIIRNILQDSKVQRIKGIHMVTAIKDEAEGFLKDWLISDRGDGKLNLHTLLSEPLLEELINYNDTGNFDRVIAMMMVMIYREELHHVKVKENKENNKRAKFMSKPLFIDNIDNNFI